MTSHRLIMGEVLAIAFALLVLPAIAVICLVFDVLEKRGHLHRDRRNGFEVNFAAQSAAQRKDNDHG